MPNRPSVKKCEVQKQPTGNSILKNTITETKNLVSELSSAFEAAEKKNSANCPIEKWIELREMWGTINTHTCTSNGTLERRGTVIEVNIFK